MATQTNQKDMSAKGTPKRTLEVCEKCFLVECCCEADRLEDEENKRLEIEDFHKAKPGSRLWREQLECPCDFHQHLAVKHDA